MKKGFEIRTVATFRIRLMIFFPLNLVNQIDFYQNEIFIPLTWLGNARLYIFKNLDEPLEM